MIEIPAPPPDEKFVQAVMSRIREEDARRISWIELLKIPALGLGLASVLFAILMAVRQPPSAEDAILAGNPDDILEYALEDLLTRP